MSNISTNLVRLKATHKVTFRSVVSLLIFHFGPNWWVYYDNFRQNTFLLQFTAIRLHRLDIFTNFIFIDIDHAIRHHCRVSCEWMNQIKPRVSSCHNRLHTFSTTRQTSAAIFNHLRLTLDLNSHSKTSNLSGFKIREKIEIWFHCDYFFR